MKQTTNTSDEQSKEQTEKLLLLISKFVKTNEEGLDQNKIACLKSIKRYLLEINNKKEMNELVFKIEEISKLLKKRKTHFNSKCDIYEFDTAASPLKFTLSTDKLCSTPNQASNSINILTTDYSECLKSSGKFKKSLKSMVTAYKIVLSRYFDYIKKGEIKINSIDSTEFIENIVSQIHGSSSFTIEVSSADLENITKTQYAERGKLFSQVSKDSYLKIIEEFKSNPWIGTKEFSVFKVSSSQIEVIRLYLNHYFKPDDVLVEQLDKHGTAAKWIYDIRKKTPSMKNGAFSTLVIPKLKQVCEVMAENFSGLSLKDN